MAEQLTRDQLAAVTARGGRLLISAAAGSGKTKVLVDRLLGFITDPVNPANIDDFLIITYTKAAASELRGKISAKLSQAAAQNPQNRHLARQLQRIYLAKISTVHSYCADILREYGYLLDIPSDFKVADELQAQALREEAKPEAENRIRTQAAVDKIVELEGLASSEEERTFSSGTASTSSLQMVV